MSQRKPTLSRLWPIGTAALVGCYALARRTRGYDCIHSELRAPAWRLRSPTLGPGLLSVARWATRTVTPVHDPRAECVDIECIGLSRPDGSALAIYLYHPHWRRKGGAALLHSHGGGMIMVSDVSTCGTD